MSKLEEELRELEDENKTLQKRIDKLKKNGIRHMDRRLEVIEEDLAVVGAQIGR